MSIKATQITNNSTVCSTKVVQDYISENIWTPLYLSILSRISRWALNHPHHETNVNAQSMTTSRFCKINSLRPTPNRRRFADDIFKCILENENEWISPRISLKFVPKFRISNIPALVQIMAWRRPGDKPLSEPMMVSLLTHICVTRPKMYNFKVMNISLAKCYFHRISFFNSSEEDNNVHLVETLRGNTPKQI